MIEKIDYTKKMQIAMRHLIVDVLSDVQRDGLPGNHHFHITFDTRYPGISINDWLSEKYPDEIAEYLETVQWKKPPCNKLLCNKMPVGSDEEEETQEDQACEDKEELDMLVEENEYSIKDAYIATGEFT